MYTIREKTFSTTSTIRGMVLLLLMLAIAGALSLPTPFSPGRQAHAQAITAPLTAFRPEVGLVYIRGDANNNVVQISFAADGSLELNVDGVVHSSNPQSPTFDPNLTGASITFIKQIRMEGGAGFDRLNIGEYSVPSELSVEVEDMLVVSGNLTANRKISLSAYFIDISGFLTAPGVFLSSSNITRIGPGAAVTARSGDAGGRIDTTAWVLVNVGQMSADGSEGGRITIHALGVMQAGTISANGSPDSGGTVQITFSQAFVANQTSITSADGGTSDNSGHLSINGGTSGSLVSSGNHFARGTAPEGMGGHIDLLGKDVALANATVDTSGESGGGTIYVGGGEMGKTPDFPAAQRVRVGTTTRISADALRSGNGGTISFWSTGQTNVYGSLFARGGTVLGNGGKILVASQGGSSFSGTSDVSALGGSAGEVVISP